MTCRLNLSEAEQEVCDRCEECQAVGIIPGAANSKLSCPVLSQYGHCGKSKACEECSRLK